MQDVKANFGLTLPTDPDAANAGKLLLTDYEVENLRTAYERTLKAVSYTHLTDDELVETTERTGIWAWKHPHHDGTTTYHKLAGDIER